MGLSSQIRPPENRQSHFSQEETYHASRATRTRNWKKLDQLQPRRKDIMRYPMVGYVLAMSLLAQISPGDAVLELASKAPDVNERTALYYNSANESSDRTTYGTGNPKIPPILAKVLVAKK